MTANIHVFYYTGPYTSTLIPKADELLARISTVRRHRFEQRAFEAQRALDLSSLRVLELGMRACGYDDFALAEIEYPSEAGISGKPYWTQNQTVQRQVDFSISHAKSIAACAIASRCRVGFDVEDQRETDPKIVARLLRADASLAVGLDASNALHRWTQIEAVLKGAGHGVMHGREIEWRDNAVMFHGQQWWVHEVDCGGDHVAHVAVNVPGVNVVSRRIENL